LAALAVVRRRLLVDRPQRPDLRPQLGDAVADLRGVDRGAAADRGQLRVAVVVAAQPRRQPALRHRLGLRRRRRPHVAVRRRHEPLRLQALAQRLQLLAPDPHVVLGVVQRALGLAHPRVRLGEVVRQRALARLELRPFAPRGLEVGAQRLDLPALRGELALGGVQARRNGLRFFHALRALLVLRCDLALDALAREPLALAGLPLAAQRAVDLGDGRRLLRRRFDQRRALRFQRQRPLARRLLLAGRRARVAFGRLALVFHPPALHRQRPQFRRRCRRRASRRCDAPAQRRQRRPLARELQLEPRPPAARLVERTVEPVRPFRRLLALRCQRRERLLARFELRPQRRRLLRPRGGHAPAHDALRHRQVLDDHRAAEQRIDQPPVAVVALDQSRRHADDAPLLDQVQRPHLLDVVQREERRPVGLRLEQQVDHGPQVLAPLQHDRVQAVRERRADRLLQPRRHAQDLPHQAHDARQLDVLGHGLALQHAARLEHHADAGVGRLRLDLELLQQRDARQRGLDADAQPLHILGGARVLGPLRLDQRRQPRAFAFRALGVRRRGERVRASAREPPRPGRDLADDLPPVLVGRRALAPQPRDAVRRLLQPPGELARQRLVALARLLGRDRRALRRLQVVLDGLQALARRLERRPRLREPRLERRRVDRRGGLRLRRRVLPQRRELGIELLDALPQQRHAFAVERRPPLEVAGVVLERAQALFARRDLAPALVDRGAQLRQAVLARLGVALEARQVLGALVRVAHRREELRVDFLPLVRVPHVQVLRELAREVLVLHRAARLPLELRDARLDLPDQQLHPLQVLARRLQPRLRFLEPGAVQPHVRGFLDQRAAVLRTQAEHLLDHALPHERVAVLPHLRAHEQLDDVT